MKKIITLFLLFFLTGCVSEPKAFISGVEDGAIYIDERTIIVSQNSIGEHNLFLNDSPISNHYTVKWDDDYVLTIKSKNWWNESESKISFTIDKQPPPKPVILNDKNKIYFNTIMFDVKREKGVRYLASINGNKIDLNKKFSKEGKHTLEVTATKPNGLSSKQTFEFEIDNRTYSQNEIDDFIQFVYDIDGYDGPYIIKWLNDVDIFVHGSPTKKDLNSLDSFVKKLNSLLPINLIIKDKENRHESLRKIDIYLVPNNDFKDYGFNGILEDEDSEIVGYAIPTDMSYTGALYDTTLLIDTTLSQKMRDTTIIHELLHSIGLYNHFDHDQTSILYPYSDHLLTVLNDRDKKMIEILYRNDVLPGMSEKELRNVLKLRTLE